MKNETVEKTAPHICPLCGGEIDEASEFTIATKRLLRGAAGMIAVGVIVLAAGKMLVDYTDLGWLGYGAIGFGAATALLCAAFVKLLD